jgi:hypothetical protein
LTIEGVFGHYFGELDRYISNRGLSILSPKNKSICVKTSNFTSSRRLIPLLLFLPRRRKYMTLHQLSIWVVVAKHLNVTKTADELHIRQPSVSQQIKCLENDSGLKLYKVNTGKGIELTQAGKLMLKYAKKILFQVETLEKKLTSSRNRRRRHR